MSYIISIIANLPSPEGDAKRPDRSGMPDKSSGKKLRILIVDDEESFRESMRYWLARTFGAKVEVVGSGTAALEKLKQGNTYDLIFLDVMMPGMDGLETYRALQELACTGRIVLMSAYSDSEQWKEADALELELISKPIREDMIVYILSTTGGDGA